MCELLRANLYEFQKHNRESADPPYFTLPRIQSIARQVRLGFLSLSEIGMERAGWVSSTSRCPAFSPIARQVGAMALLPAAGGQIGGAWAGGIRFTLLRIQPIARQVGALVWVAGSG